MLLKLLVNLGIEFGPIVAFLVASELTSFLYATTIFVALTILALIVGFIERRELAWFPLIVSLTVIGFGLLTIIFKDPFFIIIKDTLYNGTFAIVLFIGLWKDKALLKPLFRGLFSMTDKGWRILTFRWAIMFVVLTITNEIARVSFDPMIWVDYKALATVATIIFMMYQFRLSKKERLPDSNAWGMRVRISK